VLETRRRLRQFYREEAQAGLVPRVLMSLHAALDVAIARVLSDGPARDAFRRAIDAPAVALTTRLRDGVVLRHHLEDYGILLEAVRDDIYRLRELPREAVVVDVGANVGIVSVLCERRFAAARVVAFEPCDENRAILARNLAANGCRRVDLRPVAAGAQPERAPLYLSRAATHSMLRPTARHRIVDVVALDDVLGHVPAVDLLKVDVEGAEGEVLAGARELLGRTNRVAVEVHPDLGGPARPLAELLAAAGFAVELRGSIVHAVRR
jgi:FkbM family methyltransferase